MRVTIIGAGRYAVCDTGGIEMARCLEPVAMLWLELAYRQGLGTGLGFCRLRR